MNDSRIRVIPCLLLMGESLVKTVQFKKYNYVGDPINTVRIFNELEVDELIFLDIAATREKRAPNYKFLEKIAAECFMPLAYGGGIRSLEMAKRIFEIGFEKIVLNSALFTLPNLISEITETFGSQSVIGSIDYKKDFWGKTFVYSSGGYRKENKNPSEWATELEKRGVGELFLTSIQRDGTWSGYDLDLIQKISEKLNIPLIASGGAGSISDFVSAVHSGGASAVAVGSMVVYQKKNMGILINFPDKNKLKSAFDRKKM